MKSLYNIQNEYLELAQQLETGELTPELEESLAINIEELAIKSEGYLGIIAKLESEIIMAKEYEKRAKDFRTRKENAVKLLKDRLLSAVNLYGDQIIGVTEIKTRKSESVKIIDQESIPDDFLTKEVSITPDKVSIKKALKDGFNVPGVIIVQNKNLVIK